MVICNKTQRRKQNSVPTSVDFDSVNASVQFRTDKASRDWPKQFKCVFFVFRNYPSPSSRFYFILICGAFWLRLYPSSVITCAGTRPLTLRFPMHPTMSNASSNILLFPKSPLALLLFYLILIILYFLSFFTKIERERENLRE